MKALLRITGLVGAVFFFNIVVAVFLLSALPVSSAGPTERCVAGDANGDGTLSILDPLYLLEHLFQDGDPPVACAGDNQVECCWPPRPENIVNRLIVNLELDDDDLVIDDTGLTIFEVPDDQWFIVTGFGVVVEDLGSITTRCPSDNDFPGVDLVEQLGVDTTLKTTSGFFSAAAVGLRFSPGSEVVVRLRGSYPDGCDDFEKQLKQLSLVGYLVDE